MLRHPLAQRQRQNCQSTQVQRGCKTRARRRTVTTFPQTGSDHATTKQNASTHRNSTDALENHRAPLQRLRPEPTGRPCAHGRGPRQALHPTCHHRNGQGDPERHMQSQETSRDQNHPAKQEQSLRNSTPHWRDIRSRPGQCSSRLFRGPNREHRIIAAASAGLGARDAKGCGILGIRVWALRKTPAKKGSRWLTRLKTNQPAIPPRALQSAAQWPPM